MYLCISTYNSPLTTHPWYVVVNCFKMCIFALARTTTSNVKQGLCSCELLQNVYLCISTYNSRKFENTSHSVVNCFKMCIFALARTTCTQNVLRARRCELLQNVYLCISTYNYKQKSLGTLTVVNCFKMCIFALARTTSERSGEREELL